MNLIGSRPDGWWRDRDGAVRRLGGELAAFAERSGDDVTVVFDGRPVEIEGSGTVDVRFASRAGRNAADDDIATLAGPGVTVVTSDAELVRRVQAAGAGTLGAGAFRTRHLG